MNYITLNNGVKVPSLCFGTDFIREGVDEVVYNAIKIGYRHFDTAAIYQNEAGIGKGIKRAIEDGIVVREDLFITTKAPWFGPGYECTLEFFEESLAKFGLDYIDLYLIHYPYRHFSTPGEKIYHTWRAFLKLYNDGKVRSIGVSNFNQLELNTILVNSGLAPMINQLEIHPEHQQKEITSFCKDRGIQTMAWASLNQGRVLELDTLKNIAIKYNKKPSQIALRWSLQNGNIVNVKTTNVERMKENYDIFDFNLSSEDMSLIDNVKEGTFSGLLNNGEETRIGNLPVKYLESYKRRKYIRKYKLFNLITILKKKRTGQFSSKYYLFGIPVLKIYTKDILEVDQIKTFELKRTNLFTKKDNQNHE
tara:strand:- start:428 stop:1519 length:1092 start_codon:yes stop_codon:yes gene_type:complete